MRSLGGHQSEVLLAAVQHSSCTKVWLAAHCAAEHGHRDGQRAAATAGDDQGLAYAVRTANQDAKTTHAFLDYPRKGVFEFEQPTETEQHRSG